VIEDKFSGEEWVENLRGRGRGVREGKTEDNPCKGFVLPPINLRRRIVSPRQSTPTKFPENQGVRKPGVKPHHEGRDL